MADTPKVVRKCGELMDGLRCGARAVTTITKQHPEFVTPKLITVPACAPCRRRHDGRKPA